MLTNNHGVFKFFCIVILFCWAIAFYVGLDIWFFYLLQKLLWIGPPNFKLTNQHTYGESNLVLMLHKLSQQNCDITVIGKRACREIANKSNFVSGFNMIESGSVVWEFLKGRKLPGLLALDRVYIENFR